MNPFRYKNQPATPAKNAAPKGPPPPEPILLAAPHPATLAEEDLVTQCDFSKDRAGGPGGQNRNKVESRVTVLHTPTNIEAHAGERRSAVENRRVAIFRLRLALAVGVRTPVPSGEVRSELWRSRCPESGKGRISCNPEHKDYPAILGEAMDVIWASGLDVGKAALRLCATQSQLLKLVKDHPPAFVLLNQARAAAGLHRLH
ncbi:MAG TPA: peptide chain release factor-like protein [Phycisphaerales bacterium]|nr:peptide chain release factor-like protein [Phycisphaerales bacterium]